jgi:hypothetical protein
MAHHAYFVEGDVHESISKTHQFILAEMGMPIQANADILTLRYGLLSVEDARNLNLIKMKKNKLHASRLLHY